MSYQFTPEQIATITAYRGEKNFAAAYDVMADATKDINDPNVKMVHTWLQGAGAINQGIGPFAAVVFNYTQQQAALRGISLSWPDIKAASDSIAALVIDNVIESGGLVPTFDFIRKADADGAKTVYDSMLGDSAHENASAWSGVFLITPFGFDETGRLLGKGQAGVLDTVDDLKNILYADQLWSKAVLKGFQLDGIWSAMLTTWGLPKWGPLMNNPLSNFFASDYTQGNIAHDALKFADAFGPKLLLDALVKFTTGSLSGNTTDANFTSRAQSAFGALGADWTVKLLEGQDTVGLAKSDIAYRYALKELNPFAILGANYGIHNANGVLALYDPATGQGELTQEWLADRAHFLDQYIRREMADSIAVVGSSSRNETYQDMGKGLTFSTADVAYIGSGLPPGSKHYVFGDDNANVDIQGGTQGDRLYGMGGGDTLNGNDGNDYLEGDRGNDVLNGGQGTDALFGGEGNDTLDGGDGNDTLKGGQGNDTYLLQSTGGVDTVLDHGGADRLQIDGKAVSGAFRPAVEGGQVYYSEGQAYELRPLPGGDWRVSARGAGTVEYKAVADIDGWGQGEFGITTSANAPPLPPGQERALLSYPDSTHYYNMDGSFAPKGVQFDGGTKSDSFYGSNYGDLISTGGGLGNYVLANGGDDKAQGGDGQDFIRTGSNFPSPAAPVSDNDLAFGGAKSDVLLGGYGSDQLWGDAAGGGWLAAGADNGQRGDWLGGEGGNDSLYGSRASDVEFGGAGEDLLQGGAGGDLLLGDAQYAPASGVRSLPVTSPTDSYRWDATAKSMVKATAPVMEASGSAFNWSWSVASDDYTLGPPAGAVKFVVEQRLAAGGGGDVLDGGLGGDWMAGQTGGDTLDGGGGDDTLYGDDKDGLMAAADQGNDVLSGGAGNDRLFGGGGDDRLAGGPGEDALSGGGGQDTYVFNKGDGRDSLSDPDKDSVLVFGPGIGPNNIALRPGSLDLGNGDEIRIEGFDPADVFNSSSVGVFGFADGTDLTLGSLLARGFDLVGTAAADKLAGTNTVDRIRGLGGDDTLAGGAGDDTLDGGPGADKMAGGDGNDAYYVDNAGDAAAETNAAAAGGTDAVWSTLASYTLGANVENLRLLAAGAAKGTGNALANTLHAGAGDNVLDGAAGGDTASYAYATAGISASLAATGAQATGGSGRDTLLNIENLAGSRFNDTLAGNGGGNVLNGGAGADKMAGGDGGDTYYVDNIGDAATETNAAAAGGTDAVWSTLASYTLGANVENLRILAGGAAGGTGNALANTLHAGAGDNVLDGAAGVDTASYAYAAAGISASLAAAGAQATGGSGRDTLLNIENLAGGRFNDTLAGNGGGNVLTGGAGKDVLSGGAGADTFKYGGAADSGVAAAQRDAVQDFSAAQGDKIDLAALDASAAAPGDQAFGALAQGAAFGGGFAAQASLFFDQSAQVLYGNNDADAAADFAIGLAGVGGLALADFVL